jgi:hypothetical protein
MEFDKIFLKTQGIFPAQPFDLQGKHLYMYLHYV